MKRTIHAEHMVMATMAARPCALEARGYRWSKPSTVDQIDTFFGTTNAKPAPARWLMEHLT
jgi:hypothetical protein